MKIIKTKFKGLLIIKPKIFKDKRGLFFESYKKEKISKFLNRTFIQDNISISLRKHTFRGLHFQKKPYVQDKLIKVIKGKILDIVVDLRKKSQTYMKYKTFILSEKNFKQLLIPGGFAHGFLTLEKNTIVSYKVTNYFSKNKESGISIFDKKINIKLPIFKNKILLSKKDKKLDYLDVSKDYF